MRWDFILENTLREIFSVNSIYFALAAIGLNVQFGYGGLLNFGQAGFMAAGAYGMGMTTHYFNTSPWFGLFFGLAFSIVLGLLMGVPTLRLRADYLAIVTIAFAEIIRLTVRSVRFKHFFGGSDGINSFSDEFYRTTGWGIGKIDNAKRYSLNPADLSGVGRVLAAVLWLGVLVGAVFAVRSLRKRGVSTVWQAVVGIVLALAVLAAFGPFGLEPMEYTGRDLRVMIVGWIAVAAIGTIVWMLMRSPWGRVLKGIREDEIAVRSLGKNVFAYKMQALILGGCIGTFAGFVFSISRGSVQADNYSREVTFYILTALVLGGVAKVSGSIVGPMLFWAILKFLDVAMNEAVDSRGRLEILGLPIVRATSDIGKVQYMFVGAGLMLLMIFRPQGLFGNRKEMALDGR
jgi:neutral amino acid transport system permease protein